MKSITGSADGRKLEMMSNCSDLDVFAEKAGVYNPQLVRGLHQSLVEDYRKLSWAPDYIIKAWMVGEMSTFAQTEGARTPALRKKIAFILETARDTTLVQVTPSYLWWGARVGGILVSASNLRPPENWEPTLESMF